MIPTKIRFLALLALVPALQARGKTETATPAQQYQILLREYQSAQKEFRKAYADAKTLHDKQKVMREKNP